MDSRGEVLDIYDDTEIFGNATYEILDTEYGKAMKVTGKGNILILTKHPDGAKRSNSAANLYLKSFGLSMSDFKPLEDDATETPPVKIMPETGAWVYSDSEIKFLGLMLGGAFAISPLVAPSFFDKNVIIFCCDGSCKASETIFSRLLYIPLF